MLDELYESFKTHVAENNRDKIRMLKISDSIPGEIHILNMNEDGIYVKDTIEYALKPNNYVSRTLKAFMETIVNTCAYMQNDDVRIYIGEDNITAFMGDNKKEDFDQYEKVSLKLDITPGFNFAKTAIKSSANTLKYKILELFTGLPLEGEHPILSLVPMLSKVSVQESKKMQQTDDKANNSLGIDVQRSLTLKDSEVPEILDVPVRVYEQIDYVCHIKMLFRYDFEHSSFVLTPIRKTIDDAIDSTVTYMTELVDGIELKSGEIAVFPATINIPVGTVELK